MTCGPPACDVGKLVAAVEEAGFEAQPAINKIVAAQKAKKLERGTPEEMADAAATASVLSKDESELVKRSYAARLEAIEVDVFSAEEFFGVKGMNVAPGFEGNETEAPKLAASA